MALFDLVRVRITTTGTGGPLQLGIADGGGRTFADAGVPDGTIVSYGIADGGYRETGRGAYSAATNTVTRTFGASTTGAPLNLTGSAVLEITPLAVDLAASGSIPSKIMASLSATWILPNPLGRKPMVQVFLSTDEPVLADVQADQNFINITFPTPQQGYVLIF